MAYLALANEAWWTLKGATSQIIELNISPFQVVMETVGVPSVPPFTALMGTVIALLLFNVGMLLGATAFYPHAAWRPQARSIAFTSLAIAALSLTTFIHLARQAVKSTYGVDIPVTGTATIPGTMQGLDLANYTNPIVTASFTLPFYLCLASLTIIGSTSLLAFLQNPAQRLATSPLMRGLKDVAVTPLYPRQQLFRKIATSLQAQPVSATVSTAQVTGAPALAGSSPKAEAGPRTNTPVITPDLVPRPELAVQLQEGPTRAPQKTTRQERSILSSAIAVIRGYQEPVPYRQLLNDAYMDLLDRNVEFKSARQIETTLLNHVGQELALIEEPPSPENNQSGQRWWLGEKTFAKGKGQLMDMWERISENVKPRLSRVYKSLTGRPRAGYKPAETSDDDEDD